VAQIHLPHKRMASPTGRSTPGAGTVTNYAELLTGASSLRQRCTTGPGR
jgi:hypothetical protein